MCRVDEAGARSDQRVPTVRVDRQFVFSAGEVSQRWQKPFAWKIRGGLGEGVAARQPVWAGTGRTGTARHYTGDALVECPRDHRLFAVTRKPDDRDLASRNFYSGSFAQQVVDAATDQPCLGTDLRPRRCRKLTTHRLPNAVVPGVVRLAMMTVDTRK